MNHWSEEQTQYLLDHWQSGRSAKIVSEMITRKFNTRVSRAAVLGKVKRLRDAYGMRSIDGKRRCVG